MGAWGVQVFENDDALDFVSELEEATNLKPVTAALRAIGPEQYLEAPECSIALAAAEVVAALRGQPLRSLPKDVAAWVRKHPVHVDDDVLRLARMAIHRIETASELRELWEESGELKAWSATLKDLEGRLGEA